MMLAAIALAAPALAAAHTVRAGETLEIIAAAHGTTVRSLATANNLADPNVIRVGQRLRVPHAGAVVQGAVVTIRPGDTLSALAARYRVSVDDLARMNDIADPDRVRAGTRLRVRGEAAPVADGPSPSPATSGVRVVHAGDTLWSIAVATGTTVDALASANGLRRDAILAIGRHIRVPAPAARPATAGASSVVAPGDTLEAIARRFGTTVAALVRENAIADPNVIRVGARLRLPRATGGPGRSTESGTATQQRSRTPRTAATAGWGTYPDRSQIRAMIDRSAAHFGVDPALVRAVAWQESGLWQGARSSAGALGVMQLMPDTAAWVGPALLGRRIDPAVAADNIEGGTAYIAWLMRQTGSRSLAVASYYQGLGSVRARGMFDDTRRYVAAVTHLSRVRSL